MALNPPIEHQLEFAREKIKSLEQINKKMEALLREGVLIMNNSSKDYIGQMDFIKRVEVILNIDDPLSK